MFHILLQKMKNRSEKKRFLRMYQQGYMYRQNTFHIKLK